MLPNPGLRRRFNAGSPGGGIPGNALTFFAPLLTSIAPSRAVGSAVPTFMRATAAYVQDNEGVQRLAAASEARFWGARRVEQQLTKTEDFADANWLKTNVPVPTTGFPDPFGGTRAVKVFDDTTNGAHILSQFCVGYTTASRTVTASYYLKAAELTTVQLYLADNTSAQGGTATLDLSTFTFSTAPATFGAAVSCVGGVTPLTDGWCRAYLTVTYSAAATANVNYAIFLKQGSAYVGTGQGLLFCLPMSQDVTGQSVQTPAEYVSKGVLAAPYQGANVDGVQYFPTNLAGAPIAASALLGLIVEAAATQLVPTTAAIRDMAQASWALGATMTRDATPVRTGVDGLANSCTRLTGGAVAATNIISQTLAAAASSRTYSCYIKRITGSGAVRLTQDGFATTTDISGQLVSNQWVRVQLNASVLNAQYGIRIDTSGDVIDVDFNQFEAGAGATSPMSVTGASRNADSISYAAAGNLAPLLGSSYLRMQLLAPPVANAPVVRAVGGASGYFAYVNGTSGLAASDLTNFGGSSGGVLATGTPYEFASAWDGGGTVRYVRNGGAVVFPACIAGGIGSGMTSFEVPGASAGVSMTVAELRAYSVKLSDAQLSAMVA